MRTESQSSFARHVALGTASFTLCFAAWGLISAFAPRFRKMFHSDGDAKRGPGRRAGACWVRSHVFPSAC